MKRLVVALALVVGCAGMQIPPIDIKVGTPEEELARILALPHDAPVPDEELQIGPEPEEQKLGGVAPYPATAPIRPTHAQCSVRRKLGSQCVWLDGVTATNVQRAALEWATVDIYLPEAIRACRAMGTTCNVMDFTVGAVTIETARLGTNYVLKSICPRGDWFVTVQCRIYSFPDYALRKIREVMLSNAGAAKCFDNPLVDGGMQQLLDISKVGGKCVAGNPFVSPPNGAYDSRRANAGFVSTKVAYGGQPLDDGDKTALRALVDSHEKSMLWKQGLGPDPGPAVTNAGKAYEGRCKTEACHAYRRVPDFSAAYDVTWPRDLLDTFFTLEHEAMIRWAAAQVIGDGCASMGEAFNHRNAHVCASLDHPALEVRLYRPECVENCEVLTCEQWARKRQAEGPPHMMSHRGKPIAIKSMLGGKGVLDQPPGSPPM